MMGLRLDPITRRRLERFCEHKRGYYSFIILAGMIVLSLFAEFLVNNRAIVVRYEGRFYFPTFRFYSMEHFGQEDPFGFNDQEADYRRLREEWRGTNNWLILPPVPFNAFENDFDYYDFTNPPPNPPDHRHWLGTDSQGRSMIARLFYGFRISIFFALLLTAISMMIGVVVGCVQGYFGGKLDLLTQRFIEVWATLPFLYVVVLIATLLTPGFWVLLIVMAIFQWMGITYYMRTETYREKAREYAQAAKALGASHFRIIFKHLLPNALTPLVTLAPFMVIGGITSLTALDFLGYGVQPPTPSWGELIDQALSLSGRDKWWIAVTPFAAITLTLLLVTFIGEGIREGFDPKRFAKYK